MIRKIKSNTIHVFIGLCASLSLTSGLIIHFYINRMGYEVVNAWLESEAISIQEGNFVVGLSRFSRAILTSNVVTTITVFQIKPSKMTPIASYGEMLSRVDVCKSFEHQLDVMTSCRVSLFHEVIVYRSSYRPDLVVAFDLQPRVAKFLFLLLTGLITIIAGVFVIAMKRVATAEHKNRLMLIKMAIDSLISNSKPNALLLSELPDLETNWNELTSKVASMKVELEMSTREAEIGRITAQLTHDLRAPLGSIERLLFLDPDTTVRSQHDVIRKSVHRLTSMIDSLRSGSLDLLVEPRPCEFGFEQIVCELDALASFRQVDVRLLSKASIFHLKIDAPKFERALVNLVSNALDFARSEIIVKVEALDGNFIMHVIDDGSGVPDEFLPRLFQRGATHGKHNGTGLGLAYARQIMRGHGGDVRYYRENGMTVFECFLPNAVVEKEDMGESQVVKHQDIPQEPQENQPDIKQVSICFKSDRLNQRVHERLLRITTESHSFITGFHINSSIVLTDFEEMAEEAMAAEKRIIMFEDSLSDDEIVRRAPIRLGLRG